MAGERPMYTTIARIPYKQMLKTATLPSIRVAPSGPTEAETSEFIEALALHHGVIAAWFADAYFLATYQAAPRLPLILGDIAPQLDPELMKLIARSYSQMLGSGGDVAELFAPAVSLAFAHSLTFLPDGHPLGRQQLIDAVERWLRVHGNASAGTVSFESAVRYVADLGDLEFLLGIREVCARLGDDALCRAVDQAVQNVAVAEMPVKDEEGDTLHDTW
jgi:hypothetical protein